MLLCCCRGVRTEKLKQLKGERARPSGCAFLRLEPDGRRDRSIRGGIDLLNQIPAWLALSREDLAQIALGHANTISKGVLADPKAVDMFAKVLHALWFAQSKPARKQKGLHTASVSKRSNVASFAS